MVRGDVTQAARRPAALGWNFLIRSSERWEDNKMKSQRASTCAGALLAGTLIVTGPAAAQNVTFKEVAPDLHFLFDFTSSNAVVLTTNDGVLVIDTRQHPRDGEDLLARIRKITDKPIKWVINSHFHGDHHFGNPPFKTAGATFIAQSETARIMAQVQPKELARRGNFFKSRGFDPAEVKLVLPDVTFDSEMTIQLGGREIRLAYLGPGQQAGDTFVFFPHARMVFTTGMFGPRSMPNMAFTPSVEGWLKLLDRLAAMDADKILPAHGDVSTRQDVKDLSAMLADEYATVKEAIAKGMTLDDARKTLTLPQYKDWRNYARREGEITALYELIQTGKRSYFD
jgi:glyoxylase-like metal-dependent hydrolase (beta-lactamase superfamily II)